MTDTTTRTGSGGWTSGSGNGDPLRGRGSNPHRPHPEVLAFAMALIARPPAEVAAAFVVDMIEDAKEGLLRK